MWIMVGKEHLLTSVQMANFVSDGLLVAMN